MKNALSRIITFSKVRAKNENKSIVGRMMKSMRIRFYRDRNKYADFNFCKYGIMSATKLPWRRRK